MFRYTTAEILKGDLVRPLWVKPWDNVTVHYLENDKHVWSLYSEEQHGFFERLAKSFLFKSSWVRFDTLLSEVQRLSEFEDANTRDKKFKVEFLGCYADKVAKRLIGKEEASGYFEKF